jgi:hypothetical protein
MFPKSIEVGVTEMLTPESGSVTLTVPSLPREQEGIQPYRKVPGI